MHADVRNNSTTAQAGLVTAQITPPGGGYAISVTRSVRLARGESRTVTFRPDRFRQLVIRHPQLWWPYQMGGQPLYTLSASVSAGGGVSIRPTRSRLASAR